MAEGSELSSTLEEIHALVRRADILLQIVDRAKLDRQVSGHQGILAEVSPFSYASLDEILARANSLGEPPFILLLDLVQDPQNLGTLVRTADAVGVHGVVLPHRRAAHVTPAVVSASAGATEHMLIAIHNLAQAIQVLKEAGVWVLGLEGGEEAQFFQEIDMGGAMAVVVGSEGAGMRRLVRESCDFLARLPMRGQIESLNAAVAGSIMLYQIWMVRGFSGS